MAGPWRAYALLAALCLVGQLALLLAGGSARQMASELALGDTLPLMLGGLAGLAAALPHARQGTRSALGLLAALLVAAAVGLGATALSGITSLLATGQAAWKGIAACALTLPPALLAARGARRGALVAGAGALAAAIGILLAAPREVAFDDSRALVPVALFAVGSLAVALALAHEARRPHPAPARPVSPWLFPGPLALALAWALGGDLLVVIPLWVLAPPLLAAPALAKWRARPSAALVSLALLATGALLPLGACTFPNISDAIGPEDPRTYEGRVTLWEVAGHGPRWIHSDLMGGGPVHCSPTQEIAGAVWLAAIALVAWMRWPEPARLVASTERLFTRGSR